MRHQAGVTGTCACHPRGYLTRVVRRTAEYSLTGGNGAVVSFVSNVRRGAEGLFLRVFDTCGNKVVRGTGQQVGQLAVQVTVGLQEAGGRASAALADLMGTGSRVQPPAGKNARAADGRSGNGRVKDADRIKDIVRR